MLANNFFATQQYDMPMGFQTWNYAPQDYYQQGGLDFSGFSDMLALDEKVILGATDAIVEILVGFVKGFVSRNKLTKVQACVADLTDVEKQVEAILDELKTLQPSQIVDAVQKVIKLVQDGTKDLDTCKQTQQDMDAIEAWAENIAAHPSAIINNVLAHLSSLIGEISKTVGECDDASKHAQCGDDISEIVVEILGHVDDKFEVQTIDWNNVF